MSILDRLKSGLAFNKMAKAYKEIFDDLSVYNLNHDIRYVFKAAWVFNHCVVGAIEKWNWSMFAGIMIPDYQMYGRISVQEANMIVLGKIAKICQNITANDKDIIDKVLDGELFPEVEMLVSASLKERLLP